MAFSPGIGRSGGHICAKYVGETRLILTGPIADAGCGLLVATVVARKVEDPMMLALLEKKARREEEEAGEGAEDLDSSKSVLVPTFTLLGLSNCCGVL